MKTNVFRRWERIEVEYENGAFPAYRRVVIDDLNKAERTRAEYASKVSVPAWAVFLGNVVDGTKPMASEDLLQALEETGELPPQEPLRREVWAIKSLDAAKLASFASRIGFDPNIADGSNARLLADLRLLLGELDGIGTWTVVSTSSSILGLELLDIANTGGLNAFLKKAYAFNKEYFSAQQGERSWITRMRAIRAVTLGFV